VSTVCATCPRGYTSGFGASFCVIELVNRSSLYFDASRQLLLVREYPAPRSFYVSTLSYELAVSLVVSLVFASCYIGILVKRCFAPRSDSCATCNCLPAAKRGFERLMLAADTTSGRDTDWLFADRETGKLIGRKSIVGGAISFAAGGVVLALIGNLIIQYVVANALRVRAVLPLQVEDAAEVLSWPTAVLGSGLPLTDLKQGIAIRVTAMGPACASPIANSVVSNGVSGGNFTLTTEALSSSRFLHTFTCLSCVLSGQAYLALDIDAVCQAVIVEAACIDAEGGAYSASTLASATTPLLSSLAAKGTVDANAMLSLGASARVLSQITLTVPLSLSALNNVISGVRLRGHVMLPSAISVSTAVENQLAAGSPRPIKITVFMPLSDTYTRTDITPTLTLMQLIGGILGIAGAFGGFALVFDQLRNLWVKSRAVRQASSRRLVATLSPRSKNDPETGLELSASQEWNAAPPRLQPQTYTSTSIAVINPLLVPDSFRSVASESLGASNASVTNGV
jgi:hypothetical protein